MENLNRPRAGFYVQDVRYDAVPWMAKSGVVQLRNIMYRMYASIIRESKIA